MVDVYVAGEVTTGALRDTLMYKMGKAEFAIGIYAKNNYGEPWLMYEAGFLTHSCKQKGGDYLSYFFTREIADAEPPMADLHFAHYQFEPSDDDAKQNQNDFKSIFRQLNNHLNLKKRDSDLNVELDKYWHEEIQDEFARIATKIMIKRFRNDGKNAKTKTNVSVALVTKKQEIISLSGFNPKTPNEIEECFDKILKDQIPKYMIAEQDNEDRKYNAFRVKLDNTRFSTFVAFTDGKRLVVFDRPLDQKKTSVSNPVLDVFGSVQFENRSIKTKITNLPFFNASITKTVPIFGVAIEDNVNKNDENTKETVVMFGFSLFMDSSDLDLAIGKEQAIKIFDIANLANMEPEDLSSKLRLTIANLL